MSLGKPHRGSLKDWWIHYPMVDFDESEGSLGYLICGTFVDHEDFAGQYGGTSWVMKHDVETGNVETLNSLYKLIGPPIKEPVRVGR